MPSHSLLSPSSAKQWLACTPSARLSQQFEDTTSEAAEEGTVAHALAEAKLHYIFKGEVLEFAPDEDPLNSDYYCESMEDYVNGYVSFVREMYHEVLAKDPNTQVFLESRVSLTDWLPEPGAGGTRDFCIVGDNKVILIDLKYGKGVKVDAYENPQLKTYALGTISEFDMVYEFDTVMLAIYQPRMDNIATYQLSVDELLDWGNNVLKPRGVLAWAGEGEFVPGEHCKFCKVKTCAARAEYELAMVNDEFADVALLTPAEIVAILKRQKGIVSWLEGLATYALLSALNGTQYPGMKLVEGRSNRVIADEAKFVETLVAQGVAEEKLYKPKSLQGLTEIEKAAGKKKMEAVAVYIRKPAGKPTLVEESDKREVFQNAAGEFDEMLKELEAEDEPMQYVTVTPAAKSEIIEPQKPSLIVVPDGVLESPFAALKKLYKIQVNSAKGKPVAKLVEGEMIDSLDMIHDYIVTKSPNEPNYWMVFELSSGRAVSQQFENKQDAIKDAENNVTINFNKLEELIAKESAVLEKLKVK